jgi:hypothetical protein
MATEQQSENGGGYFMYFIPAGNGDDESQDEVKRVEEQYSRIMADKQPTQGPSKAAT